MAQKHTVLKPCQIKGRRCYFNKADLVKLMEEYPTHEKGAHTFSKVKRKKEKIKNKKDKAESR